MTLTIHRLRPSDALLLLAALVAALVVYRIAPGRPQTTVIVTHTGPQPVSALSDVPLTGVSTRQQIDGYAAVVRAQPRNAQAYDDLALAELQQVREDGDPRWYTKADGLLHRALQLNPQDFTALGGLGSLAASRHQFSLARRLGRRALSIDPSSTYALGVVVDADVELGDYGGAGRALRRMLNVRPDLSSYSRLSYYLELHGNIKGARRALEQAIASGAPARENVAWAYLYLGNLDFNHDHYAAAQREYRLAAQAEPGFVHAVAAEAKLAAARGHLGRAERLYVSATARLPLPAYVIALGDVQAAEGKHSAAEHTYGLVRAEEALYVANGVNVDVELALFEADHGDPKGGLAHARAAASVQHSVVVEDALGWTLFNAGHPRAGLRAADRALRLGTLDASFLFHRGAIEASLGMRAAARSDLAEALRVNPHFSVLYEPKARHLLAEVSR